MSLISKFFSIFRKPPAKTEPEIKRAKIVVPSKIKPVEDMKSATAADSRIPKIKETARFAIEHFKTLDAAAGINIGLNAPTVKFMEGFIERQRLHNKDLASQQHGLVGTLGALLGECIVAEIGGEWVWNEQYQTFGINIDKAGTNACFPFFKVDKQFNNGVEGGDSVYGFYETIIAMMRAEGLAKPAHAAGG